jgi:hypothetical protein
VNVRQRAEYSRSSIRAMIAISQPSPVRDEDKRREEGEEKTLHVTGIIPTTQMVSSIFSSSSVNFFEIKHIDTHIYTGLYKDDSSCSERDGNMSKGEGSHYFID